MNTVTVLVFEIPCPDTVAVEKKSSHASMCVVDVQEAVDALEVLTKSEYPTEGFRTSLGTRERYPIF